MQGDNEVSGTCVGTKAAVDLQELWRRAGSAIVTLELPPLQSREASPAPGETRMLEVTEGNTEAVFPSWDCGKHTGQYQRNWGVV